GVVVVTGFFAGRDAVAAGRVAGAVGCVFDVGGAVPAVFNGTCGRAAVVAGGVAVVALLGLGAARHLAVAAGGGAGALGQGFAGYAVVAVFDRTGGGAAVAAGLIAVVARLGAGDDAISAVGDAGA